MSENPNISSLFDHSGNLTMDSLERYLKGKLTPDERTIVEKHLDESPFDREALEGLRSNSGSGLQTDISELNAWVSQMAGERKTVRIKSPGKRYYWVAAASLVAVVSLAVLLVFMFRNAIQTPELALARPDTLMEKAIENYNPVVGAESLSEVEEVNEIIEDSPPATEQGYKKDILQDNKNAEAPSPPAPIVKISVVEDDLDEESDMLVKVDEPSSAPSIGGVMDVGNTNRLTQDPKRNAKASYTIQADQVEKMASAEMAEEESAEDSVIFMVVEQMPEFPGGQDSLYKFLVENLHYPDSAKVNGIQGRVFVTFVVESDGSINDVKVLRGIGGGCDEEAVRVVKMMPKWTPGIQRGKPVRVQYNMPIMFRLD